MDFQLSEEQNAFVEAAKDFSDARLAPNAAEWDRDHHFPVDVIREAGELGFCGLFIDPDHGGLGLSRIDASLIFEQLSMGCTATTAYLTIHNMVGGLISKYASPAILDKWIEKLATGEALASYCLTEPGSGSDAASLRTKAVKVEGGFRISGSKMFISGAGSTQVLLVMARTGEAGASGVSAFVVPADAEGIHYGREEDKLGWNCQPTRLVEFDSVFVPEDQLLGSEGEGFKLAMKALDGGRINIASCSLGTAQQAINSAKAYMLERQQFGRPIAQFQALQFKLADMATELTAARQLVRFAASELDNNSPQATMHCAMAKRFATDMGFTVCNDALQIFGGYGYTKEFPIERHMRDTRVHQILEGTNEIMRVIVARHLLADA